jgi:HSP20 family protein
MPSVEMAHVDSLVREVEQMQQRIAQRAYDLFLERGAPWGSDDNWFAAEHEMVRRPAVELSEKDGAYTVLASLAGVEPRDMHLSIAPQDLVIKAENHHSHHSDNARVHQCELRGGSVFRSVHFPRPVDINHARAEYRNGMLTVTAPIAKKAQAARLDVKVA